MKIQKNSKRGFIRTSLRFDVNDYVQLKARQEMAEYPTFAKFLKDMAMHGQILKIDISHAQESVRLIRNIANNINQIAKRVNTTSEIFLEDINVLEGYLQQILELETEIVEGVNELK